MKAFSVELVKEFTFPILSVLVVIILSIFFLIPKTREIYSLINEREKVAKQVENLSQKLLDLQTLSEAELFDSANLLLSALPEEKDFYKTLSLIKSFLWESGVDLISFDFSPGGMETLQESQPMAIKIFFSSTLTDLKAFSQALEKSLPLMSIGSLKITASPATGSAERQRTEGTLTIKSYFLPLPKTLGKVDQPLAKITSEDLKLIEELKSYQHGPYETERSVEELAVPVGKENPFP